MVIAAEAWRRVAGVDAVCSAGRTEGAAADERREPPVRDGEVVDDETVAAGGAGRRVTGVATAAPGLRAGVAAADGRVRTAVAVAGAGRVPGVGRAPARGVVEGRKVAAAAVRAAETGGPAADDARDVPGEGVGRAEDLAVGRAEELGVTDERRRAALAVPGRPRLSRSRLIGDPRDEGGVGRDDPGVAAAEREAADGRALTPGAAAREAVGDGATVAAAARARAVAEGVGRGA